MTTDQPRTYPFACRKLDVDPHYALLRREEPLCRVQLPYGEPAWLATRYDDVKAVLSDPRFSRAAAVGRDQPRSRPYPSGAGSMISLDPPDHTRLRRLATKAFTARRIEALRPRAQKIADELVEAMRAKGTPAELVEDFALPLPITVICELLGVPFEDRADFRLWSDAFLSTTKFTLDEVTAHRTRLRTYITGLIAERRETPRDDLMTALVAARDDEDRLSEEELLSMVETILVAGHETTASQIPNFLHTLLAHPDQLAALRADLGLVPQAVEELLRYVPLGAGGSQPRYALEDVELGGVTVRAGEPVIVAAQSANRDESVYTSPDELDLGRREASHVGFGHGPHHCLGASLARMELQVALRTLLVRLPGLRLAGDIVWKTGVATRGPERMPITWEAS
ncbi:cytochrome P450 [Streptomyces sp. NPDC101062]|uniref:cytochrome P450 n=1 Tax=unclassified Streptomyces TaxID=2593676 RepID=UPI00380AEEA6